MSVTDVSNVCHKHVYISEPGITPVHIHLSICHLKENVPTDYREMERREEEEEEMKTAAEREEEEEEQEEEDDDDTDSARIKKKKTNKQEGVTSCPDRKCVPGIIYLGHIPPRFRPKHLRNLMSVYGEIGRIFLQPEGIRTINNIYHTWT